MKITTVLLTCTTVAFNLTSIFQLCNSIIDKIIMKNDTYVIWPPKYINIYTNFTIIS